MKTFLNHFLFSDVSVAVFTALGALGVLCFYSTRYGFVFVDNALFKNFALALFLLAVLGEVCLFTVFALRVHHSSLLPELSAEANPFRNRLAESEASNDQAPVQMPRDYSEGASGLLRTGAKRD